MKIRSLLLGSIAAAGLSTGAFAADPTMPVLTTLDLCDALGLTGITVSSDTNCLQISGEVKYEFVWGDYKGTNTIAAVAGGYDAFTIIDNDFDAATPPSTAVRDQDWSSRVDAYFKVVGTADTDVGPAKGVIKMKHIDQQQTRNENNLGHNGVGDATFFGETLPAVLPPGIAPLVGNDGLLGTGDDPLTSAGPDGKLGTADDITRTRTGAISGATSAPTALPAGAAVINAGADGIAGNDDDVIRLVGPDGKAATADDVFVTRRGAVDDYAATGGDHTAGFVIDEAYVSIGGATVLSAGKKGSIFNKDDDAPFNWLGLFLSEKVDTGVYMTKDLIPTGGHVIQLVHGFANGLTGMLALENLQGTGAKAGTAIGVLAYAGENLTAHVSVAAGGILDGTVENWGIHAGATGTFNILKVRGAIAADSTTYWNALGSAEVTFDMFKLAWSGEAASGPTTGGTDFGVGASATVTVTDGVTINLGGRYYQDANGPDGYQVAGQIAAAVTETLTLTGEVGVYGTNAPMSNVYGAVTLAYAPGGGFTSSLKGEVSQNGAYRATFKAGKVIE